MDVVFVPYKIKFLIEYIIFFLGSMKGLSEYIVYLLVLVCASINLYRVFFLILDSLTFVKTVENL